MRKTIKKPASLSHCISVLDHSKTLPSPVHFNAYFSSLNFYPIEHIPHISTLSFLIFSFSFTLFVHPFGQLDLRMGNMVSKIAIVAVFIELTIRKRRDFNQIP